MTASFNNKMPQPRYWFIWNVEKVIKSPDTLNSETLQLKFLTYKLIMLLALTSSSWDHEIC